jgi:hypothetical protein
LYDILEERKMRPFLVNAQDTKNMPGRKSDIQECQWLMKLHAYGLLKNSFRPEMNLQLANVISDISGATGQAIVDAILAGERDPQVLAKLRDPRIKASEEVVAKSLEGNWRPELLFVLQQESESFQTFQKKIAECDEALYRHYQSMEAKADPKLLPAVPRDKRARGRHVPESFNLRDEMYRVTAGDLTAIHGVNVLTAQTVLAEVGWDMQRFPTEGDFVSFLDLSPKNKISGGKIIGRDKRKTKNRAGLALRLAAGTLLESQTYLGAQYRRFRTKLGAPKARKAMGARLARIIYRMLKYGQEYMDKGNEFYEQKYRQLQIRRLTKKAAELGFEIVKAA